MSTEDDQSARVVLAPPAPLLGRGLAFAATVAAMVLATRALTGGMGPSLSVLVALFALPLLMIADDLAATIAVDDDGLERVGLLGRRQRLSWEKMSRVHLQSGRADHRAMVVRGGRKKLAFSSVRGSFFTAARVILAAADAREVPVHTPLLMSRDGWLAPAPPVAEQ